MSDCLGGTMAFGKKKTPEELAAEAQAKRAADVEKATRKAAEQVERERQAFLNSPAGQARSAFERGHSVFQVAMDVMSQQAVIVAMVGGSTTKKTTDPVDVLNSICREGWELVNGSFVFVEQGQESRDKFLASGQNVAIKGTTVGYYLFRRAESARVIAVS
jgi:hypothetical protein